MKIIPEWPPFSWDRFFIHAACGLVIGLIAGWQLSSWILATMGLSPWVTILTIGFALAITAGYFGDRFWHSYIRTWFY